MYTYFPSRHFLTFLAYFSVKSISEYSKYVRRCAVMRKNEVQKQRMHCVNALDISGIQARFCDRTLLPYRRNQRSLNPPKIRSFPVPKTLPERRRAIAFLATAPFFVFPFLRQPGLLLIRPHPLCIPGEKKAVRRCRPSSFQAPGIPEPAIPCKIRQVFRQSTQSGMIRP